MQSTLCVWGILIASTSVSADQPQWHQWRGPTGNGVASQGNPPVEWSEKKNIRWKTKLPGRGHSTPVIHNNRIFLTAAVPFGEKLKPRMSGAPGAHDNLPITRKQKYVALAVDRNSGKILWQHDLHKALPHEGGHHTASLASASPITDGKHIYAFFGSQGLYCLDLDGKLIWKKPIGKLNTKHGHGEGSTPALYNSTIVINADHEGQSFIMALDSRTGKLQWEKKREEVTSWSSPVIVKVDGKPQVIVPGTGRTRAYDLANGKVIWECSGLSGNVVASPVVGDGLVHIGSSYEIRAMLTIRLSGSKGNITGTKQVVWKRDRATPYVPSPLLYNGALYYLRHYQGVLSRVDAKTGKDLGGPFRIAPLGDIYASPVAASDRIYITDRRGVTMVLSHSKTAAPKVLSINRLGDTVNASAAIVGDALFLRGEQYLYCIAEKKNKP